MPHAGRRQKFCFEQGYQNSEIPQINDYLWKSPDDQNDILIPYRPIKKKSCIAPSALCPLPSALMLNQAFIFPTPKQGNETIRLPIYIVKWTESLARNCTYEENIEVVMKNSIWHEYN